MVPTTKKSPPQSAKHVRSASDEPLLVPKYRPSYSDLSTDTADVSVTTSSEDDFDFLLRTNNLRYYYSDGTEAQWAVMLTIKTWILVLPPFASALGGSTESSQPFLWDIQRLLMCRTWPLAMWKQLVLPRKFQASRCFD